MSSSKSPCTGLCKFTDDICLGCGRSKKEIKAWKKLDKDERREVIDASKQRLAGPKASGRRKKK